MKSRHFAQRLRENVGSHITHAYIAVFLCLILTGFIIHDRIGIFVWNIWHAPDMALLLHRDAGFAVTIGNYYFNVGGT